ncbi:hypothetical protein SPSYN_01484 [Sporotomaculum syntrophicum]|uniref:Uncharacterized protein n=1 Tax=Sporotomaculum syntrophicum TaxID=182264 RepID=A0A9D3AZ18_9FIRM|nr:hypothetical protein SPSYN_01484 [Sporotomaculum syntrophicum]
MFETHTLCLLFASDLEIASTSYIKRRNGINVNILKIQIFNIDKDLFPKYIMTNTFTKEEEICSRRF